MFMNKVKNILLLVIVSVVLIIVLAGCRGNSGKQDALKIEGHVTEIEQYGHAALDITIDDFEDAGFQLGDVITVDAGSYTGDIPYLDGYYVDKGEYMVRAYPGDKNIALCINYGKFAETAKVDVGDAVTLTLKKKAGAITLQEINSLKYTNERDDYESDEVFANFRPIVMGKIARGRLYRSASPVNNEFGRASYANAFAEANGIKSVMNLASTDDDIKGFIAEKDFKSDYYKGLYDAGNVIALGLPIDYESDDFGKGIAKGLTFLSEHEGPYLVHCNEGKDRAGFASMVIEALMGASIKDIRDDYMQSYINYYGVDPGTKKYEMIVEKNIDMMIREVAGFKDDAPLENVDLKTAAEEYLSAHGMSKDAIATLQEKLTGYYDMEFHRGGRDARPENTMYAFQYALENGASTIECDIQMTKDGELVVIHNFALNPDVTTDAHGVRVEDDKYYIHDMTLEEIQSYNVGRMDKESEYYDMHGRTQVQADAAIPTLRQLFELVEDNGNDDIRLSIEVKYYSDPEIGIFYEKNPDKDAILKAFLNLVNEFGYKDRVSLQSMDWDILIKMKKLDPEIETVAVYSEEPEWGGADSVLLWLDRKEPSPWLGGLNIHDFDDDPVKAAASVGIDVVSPYYGEITKAQVKEAHKLGIKVIPWTVNDPEDIKATYEMGVDGIITDKPWVLRDVLEELGEKLPPVKKLEFPYHLDPDHIEVEETEKVSDGKDAAY